MPSIATALCICIGFVLAVSAQAQNPSFRRHKVSIAKPLTVYFIDVEGGQSTLFVTPSHESLLIDAGWPDYGGRDAERILAAAKLAGLDHIDYLLNTHFHEDHAGGIPNLAHKISIGTYIDHGANREPENNATKEAWDDYQALLAHSTAKHIVAKPGDTIPLAGLTTTIVSEDGSLVDTPLPGAGQPNPYCKNSSSYPTDQTENARSVGIVMQYGKARLIDLGDLTSDKEVQLMCPVNKLGQVDVLVVSHHGTFSSSGPALVDGIASRLAIMDNGENKGGAPSVWETIEKSPRLKNLWQLHYSAAGGEQHNVAAPYIANLKGGTDGNYIRLSVYPNGALSVFNSRTQQSVNYPAQ